MGAGSSGALDPESLQMWVVKSVTPLVGLFSWDTGARYQEIGLPELAAYTRVRSSCPLCCLVCLSFLLVFLSLVLVLVKQPVDEYFSTFDVFV